MKNNGGSKNCEDICTQQGERTYWMKNGTQYTLNWKENLLQAAKDYILRQVFKEYNTKHTLRATLE